MPVTSTGSVERLHLFQLRAFHDTLVKNGNVPLSLKGWELLGLGDQVDALAR